MVNGNSIPNVLRLCRQPAASCRFEGRGDQRSDPGETQPALEKLGNSDLVRCIQHGRRAAACLQRMARQGKGGKTLKVGSLEIELGDLREVEPRRRPVD